MSDEKSTPWEVYKFDSTHNSVVYVIRPFCRITIDCRENFGDAVLLANEIVAAHQSHEDLLAALEAIVAIKRERICTHDAEWDYCDCCHYAWEKEVWAARERAEAAIKAARYEK